MGMRGGQKGSRSVSFGVVARSVVWVLSVFLLLVPVAEAQELRVGFLAPLTGIYAPTGRDMLDGFELYLDEVGHQFSGIPVRVIAEDYQLDPGVALTKARKLVDSDGVTVLAGLVSSPATYALREYIDSRGIPTVVAVASGDDVTQRIRAEYMVRLGWGTSSQAAHAFGEYVAKELNYRRVVTIGDDFAFGHEWVGGFERTFEAAGGEIVRKLWVPLGTNDFSPYLAQIPRNVDAVVGAVVGPPAVRFLKQYHDFGMSDLYPLVGPGHLSDESILPQLGEEAVGLITALHYSAHLDTPENRRFVNAFRERTGRFPSAYAEGGYAVAMWLDEAMNQGGLKAAQGGAALLEALLAVEVAVAPRGPIAIDDYANVVHNIYVRRVEMGEDGLQNTVIATYPSVSQFWNWSPEEYLAQPVYSRNP